MTTTPGFSHALFTTPFDHTTDFTELADNCSQFKASCRCKKAGWRLRLPGLRDLSFL